ncbi:MAG: NADH-quinone oxidoreductase subunit J [Verrucomicrobiae bacterium]|nr:NADH-quinone oxidoreductase subunit J [Verrucomicrobiae bacterium]
MPDPKIQLVLFLGVFFLTVSAGFYAVSLRNLVHAALFLILTFACLGGVFILLNADFLGAVQLLVYVGAVAVLVLFAVMLTRNVSLPGAVTPAAGTGLAGVVLALVVFTCMAASIFADPLAGTGPAVPVMVRDRVNAHSFEPTTAGFSRALIEGHAVAFQIAGLLLTAALMSAILLAQDFRKKQPGSPADPRTGTH